MKRACQYGYVSVYNIFLMHLCGPYANLHDLHVILYIGLSLVKMRLNDEQCGGGRCEVQSKDDWFNT